MEVEEESLMLSYANEFYDHYYNALCNQKYYSIQQTNMKHIRARTTYLVYMKRYYIKEICSTDCFKEATLSGEENLANAFCFVMGHFMIRGRDNVLSISYKNSYAKILGLLEKSTMEQFIQKKNVIDGLLASNATLTMEEVAKKFNVQLEEKNNYKANLNDLKMLSSLLQYQIRLFNTDKVNIFDHIVDMIINNEVNRAYHELLAVNYVGDKLASVTLRDIVFLSKKCSTIKFEYKDYLEMFPVDALTYRALKDLMNIDKDIEKDELKAKVIDYCIKEHLTCIDPLFPLKLNAGIWYHYAWDDSITV